MLSIAEAKAKLYLNEKCCPLAHLVLGRGGTKAYLPPPNPHTFLSAIIFFKFTYTTVNYHTFFRRGGCERIFMIFGRIFFSFFFFKIFLDLSPPPTNTQHTFKSIARCLFQVTISILNYII